MNKVNTQTSFHTLISNSNVGKNIKYHTFFLDIQKFDSTLPCRQIELFSIKLRHLKIKHLYINLSIEYKVTKKDSGCSWVVTAVQTLAASVIYIY